MQRYRFLAVACALGAAVLALPLARRALLADATPKSLADVEKIADELGIRHRYDGVPGGGCLLVTERELPDTANGPRVGVPKHPFWTGTVAVYPAAHQMWSNYDPAYSIIWGNLFVYGDPGLIEKLTGHRPLHQLP